MCLVPFSKPRTRATHRIGPHSFNILSLLIGSILGDASVEKHGEGTRICFQQEHSNNAILINYWLAIDSKTKVLTNDSKIL